MASTRFESEKFSSKNDFVLWRIKMRALLVQHGLVEAIKGEKGFASTVSEEKRNEIMEKAHSAIILSLADNVMREVSKETTAAGVWARLEQLYMTKSFANRLYMKQCLYSYKFSENRGMVEQLEGFNQSLDDLESIDVKLEDEDKAIILLNALPKSFKNLKDAMLFGRESSISLDEVQSALKAKELQRLNEGKQEVPGEGLDVKNFKAGKGKQKGPSTKKSWQGKGNEIEHKETRKCHFCKKPGHLKKDCYSWKKKQAEKDLKPPNTADCAEGLGDAEMLNVAENHMENAWIMDSGCSFHMRPYKEWFSDLKLQDLGSVLLGNNQVCKVKGLGYIRLRLHDNSIKVLSEVRYIPQLKRNLISLGMLESNGYSFQSSQESMHVIKNSAIVLKGVRKNSLYHLIAETIIGNSDIVNHDETILWHKRLAHVGEKGLTELVKKGILENISAVKMGNCEQCILGKSKKKTLPKLGSTHLEHP